MKEIDYILSINIKGSSSGKEKASSEKIKYLQRLSNLHTYTLDAVSSSKSFKSVKMIILDLYYLVHVIFTRRRKPDLIFARSNFHFGPFIISKIYKIPLINEVHGDILDEGKTLFKDSFLKKTLGFIWHHYWLFFLKRSNGLIFNNSLLEKHYKKHYLRKTALTITIHNGCDPEFFYPLDKDEARGQLGLEKDVTYLLFIGSISRWHGVENLLETARYIKQKKDDREIKLLIVGGYDEDYLHKLKKTYNNAGIIFTGETPKADALYYINAADLCLLPVNDIRISPGSPLKLFDYAACGKPIISQKSTVGYSDLIEKYSLGISCDFTSHREAASVILQFLHDCNEDQYKYHNRKIAEKYLSWEIILKKWLEFGELVTTAK